MNQINTIYFPVQVVRVDVRTSSKRENTPDRKITMGNAGEISPELTLFNRSVYIQFSVLMSYEEGQARSIESSRVAEGIHTHTPYEDVCSPHIDPCGPSCGDGGHFILQFSMTRTHIIGLISIFEFSHRNTIHSPSLLPSGPNSPVDSADI